MYSSFDLEKAYSGAHQVLGKDVAGQESLLPSMAGYAKIFAH
jgi:hypothetical protein